MVVWNLGMCTNFILNFFICFQCVTVLKCLSPLDEDRFLSPNNQHFYKDCDHGNINALM